MALTACPPREAPAALTASLPRSEHDLGEDIYDCVPCEDEGDDIYEDIIKVEVQQPMVSRPPRPAPSPRGRAPSGRPWAPSAAGPPSPRNVPRGPGWAAADIILRDALPWGGRVGAVWGSGPCRPGSLTQWLALSLARRAPSSPPGERGGRHGPLSQLHVFCVARMFISDQALANCL